VARVAQRASANAASSRFSGTTATVVRPPDVTSSVLRSLAAAVLRLRGRPITPLHLAVWQCCRACQSSAMDRIGAQRQMQVPALAAGPVHGPAPVGRRARAVLTRSMDASGRPRLKLLAVCAVRLRGSEQNAPKCRARVRRAGWEMMDPTGSQRLHIARLRRLLPIPWHRRPASVPWRPRHRSASGPIRPCPHASFALSASRCAVPSMHGSFDARFVRCTVRSRGGISGYRLRSFHFPLHE
jgi:hypothetical protein